MKIKRLMLLLSYWLSTGLNAQEIEIEAPKLEVVIKAYTNFLYFNSQYNPRPYDFSPEFFRFWGITPAVSFRAYESPIIQEIEPKYWSSNSEDGNIKEYEVGLRYELCWYLKNEIVPGVRFRWGGSSRFYYYHADVSSGFNGFPTIAQNGGFELSLVAHLEFRIFKKIIVEINTSNLNVNFEIDDQYIDNPGLTENQKTSTGFDFEAFNQRILRIGIGYEF